MTCTGMVSTPGQMVAVTSEAFSKIRNKDMEYTNGLMAGATKATGTRASSTAWVFTLAYMVILTASTYARAFGKKVKGFSGSMMKRR